MQHRKMPVWNDKRRAQAGIEVCRDIKHPAQAKDCRLAAEFDSNKENKTAVSSMK